MTVHAIEIVSATEQQSSPDVSLLPEPPSAVEALHDRIETDVLPAFDRWPDEDTEMTLAGTEGDSVEHVLGRYRFAIVEDKQTIVDAIESDVVTDMEWYEVRHHECDHDEPSDERAGCSGWTTERSYGSVPL